MHTTSALAGRWEPRRRLHGQSAIAARRRMSPKRSNGCCAHIVQRASQGRISAAFSRATLTTNYVSFLQEKKLPPSSAICLPHLRRTRWKADAMSYRALFPMFLKLEGRNCLVLGAGSVGEQKIRG